MLRAVVVLFCGEVDGHSGAIEVWRNDPRASTDLKLLDGVYGGDDAACTFRYPSDQPDARTQLLMQITMSGARLTRTAELSIAMRQSLRRSSASTLLSRTGVPKRQWQSRRRPSLTASHEVRLFGDSMCK